MNVYIEVLKLLGALMVVIVPAMKLFHGARIGRARGLEAQHQKIKDFFKEGGTGQHPLLVELAFGTAVGHTKFTASEIPLLLTQSNPTSFMRSYIKVKDYLSPNITSTKFELQSTAAKPMLRKILVTSGLGLYVSLAGIALWLLLYLLPLFIKAGLWAQVGAVFVLISIAVLLAVFFLIEASKLHWAQKLYSRQKLID